MNERSPILVQSDLSKKPHNFLHSKSLHDGFVVHSSADDCVFPHLHVTKLGICGAFDDKACDECFGSLTDAEDAAERWSWSVWIWYQVLLTYLAAQHSH